MHQSHIIDINTTYHGMDKKTIALTRLLLARLERISADSYWAHRASGARGSLLRVLEKIEKGRPVQPSELKRILEIGFFILEKAAEETSRTALYI